MEVKANEEPTITRVELPPKAILNEVEWKTEEERNDQSKHKDGLIFWSINLLSYELGWLVQYITQRFERLDNVLVERDERFEGEVLVYIRLHFYLLINYT